MDKGEASRCASRGEVVVASNLLELCFQTSGIWAQASIGPLGRPPEIARVTPVEPAVA